MTEVSNTEFDFKRLEAGLGTPRGLIPANSFLHLGGLCREIGNAFNMAAESYEAAGTATQADAIIDKKFEGDNTLIEIHAKLMWVLECLELDYNFDDEVPYTDVVPYPEDTETA